MARLILVIVSLFAVISLSACGAGSKASGVSNSNQSSVSTTVSASTASTVSIDQQSKGTYTQLPAEGISFYRPNDWAIKNQDGGGYLFVPVGQDEQAAQVRFMVSVFPDSMGCPWSSDLTLPKWRECMMQNLPSTGDTKDEIVTGNWTANLVVIESVSGVDHKDYLSAYMVGTNGKLVELTVTAVSDLYGPLKQQMLNALPTVKIGA